MRRIALTASLLTLGLALAGCESIGGPDDWFSPKKTPLPGERKAVFPSGVPGVPQGVPPELVEGYKPLPEPPPQVVEEKPKPKPKPRPRPQQAAAPPPQQPTGQPVPPSPFPEPPRR